MVHKSHQNLSCVFTCGEDSIKNIIERAMPGSVLEKIKKSEARRLTRVSTEAAALSQALKSYIGGVQTAEEP